MKTRWEPLFQDLEAETGLSVCPVFGPDYGSIIVEMRNGRVQVAFLGNKAAIEVVDRAPVSLFATPLGLDGEDTYQAFLIARVGSPLTTIDDVVERAASLNFANGDPHSTSGYIVPWYYLFDLKGVDPRRGFKHVSSGSHEANLLAVANGTVDIATISSSVLELLSGVHPKASENIKIVWRSPAIANDPLVWRTDLPEEARVKLARFFLSYGQPGRSEFEREREVLRGLGWSGFKPSDNSQLDAVRRLLD